MGFKTRLYSSICWFSHRTWSRLEVSYMTAANGGGGFLLVFLISTILIGFPLLLAEFALGRSAGVSAIKTFGKLGKNNKYNFIGWIGAFCTLYPSLLYSVIGGWILVYLGIEFGKLFHLGGTGDYLSYSLQSFQIQPLLLGLQAPLSCWISLLYHVGFKRDWKSLKSYDALPPLSFLSLSLDALSVCQMPGRRSLLPQTRLLKTDQCWFPLCSRTIFLCSFTRVTAMLTYASYLDKKTNLVQSGISIVAMNISVSIMAGLAIFPGHVSLQYSVWRGDQALLFIVLPQPFDKMPFGNHFHTSSSSCSSFLRRSLPLSWCWKSM